MVKLNLFLFLVFFFVGLKPEINTSEMFAGAQRLSRRAASSLGSAYKKRTAPAQPNHYNKARAPGKTAKACTKNT